MKSFTTGTKFITDPRLFLVSHKISYFGVNSAELDNMYNCVPFIWYAYYPHNINHKGILKNSKTIIVFDLNMTLNSFDLHFQMTIQLSVKWNANLSKQN